MNEFHRLQETKFLPLCDVLFNIISLFSYFCDIVFDIIVAYALINYSYIPYKLLFLNIFFVILSLFISQIVSLNWYLWGPKGKLNTTVTNDVSNCINLRESVKTWDLLCVYFLHLTQCGVLWRYFKLFIPVNLTCVKYEIRELCILRLTHAFCEAAPLLLLQVYFLKIYLNSAPETNNLSNSSGSSIGNLRKLTTISASLSLWNVCWSVASFSKGAVRLRNLEKLVLTWLGVLTQLVWRVGTVTARVGALITYASIFGGQSMLIVIILHWITMLSWLLASPEGLFYNKENLHMSKKIYVAATFAFVYIFSYINLHETNHRFKRIIFYSVMFLENSLLVGLWAVSIKTENIGGENSAEPYNIIFLLTSFFFGGLLFMALYYRYFHVRRLHYEDGGRLDGYDVDSKTSIQDTKFLEPKIKKDFDFVSKKNKRINGKIPGVFNCRFSNPTITTPGRKKKIPSTFIPPPTNENIITLKLSDINVWSDATEHEKNSQITEFWKKPLLKSSSNYDDNLFKETTSIHSKNHSLNLQSIHQKLREKKDQQLRELHAIQEEIKERSSLPVSSNLVTYASFNSLSSRLHSPYLKHHKTLNALPANISDCYKDENICNINFGFRNVEFQIKRSLSSVQIHNNLFKEELNIPLIYLTHELCSRNSNWPKDKLNENIQLLENGLKDNVIKDDFKHMSIRKYILARSNSLPKEVRSVNNNFRRFGRYSYSYCDLPLIFGADDYFDSKDNKCEGKFKTQHCPKSKHLSFARRNTIGDEPQMINSKLLDDHETFWRQNKHETKL